jgi:hypothetical protein
LSDASEGTALTWKIFANNFESGELSNTNKFVNMDFEEDTLLRAVRTWIVVYNDATFTSLNMDVYTNRSDNTPGVKLASSTNSLTKSEIITLDNGVKEIYFTFNDVLLDKDDSYNFVMQGVGYSPTSTSYLAWVQAFPDPVYTINGFTSTLENINRAPYRIYAIGAKF